MAKPSYNTPIPSGEGGVPIVLPQTGAYGEAIGENQTGVKPTYWEKFWAESAQALSEAPYESLQRFGQQTQLQADLQAEHALKLTPEQANKQFPGLPEPFKEPVYPEVAKLIADHNERKQRARAWIDRGPQTGFGFDLAAGATTAIDPFNLVGGILAGEVTGAVGLTRGLGTIFGENLAINAGGTIPGIIQGYREQQGLPPVGDVLTNIAGGALVGTGLHFAINKMLGRAAEAESVKPIESIEKKIESAISQHESGARVDMSPAAVLEGARAAGVARPGVDSAYEFQRLKSPSDVNYYTPTDANGAPVSAESGVIRGADNPQIAHNQANPDGVLPGKVIRSELSPDAKILSGETPLLEAIGGKAEEALAKIKAVLGDKFEPIQGLFKTAIENGRTVGEVLAELRPQVRRDLVEGLGYDGLHTVGEIGGTPTHNQIEVYNSEHLNPLEVSNSDPGSVPKYDSEAQQKLSEASQEVTQGRGYSEELSDQTKAHFAETTEKIKPEAESYAKQAEQNARSVLEERAKADSSIEEEVASIDEDHAKEKELVKASKILADCMADKIT